MPGECCGIPLGLGWANPPPPLPLFILGLGRGALTFGEGKLPALLLTELEGDGICIDNPDVAVPDESVFELSVGIEVRSPGVFAADKLALKLIPVKGFALAGTPSGEAKFPPFDKDECCPSVINDDDAVRGRLFLTGEDPDSPVCAVLGLSLEILI